MKTIGIIGGIAPESTIEYYRQIVSLYRRQKHDGDYPPIIINSINMKHMLDLIAANDLAGVTDYLLGEMKKLVHAGANLGLLASNTPHIAFEELRRQSPLPLISIVEATCGIIKALKLSRVGLFGTRFTMRGDFYQKVFSKEGITLVIPNDDEQAVIHEKYMNELVNGIFLPKTHARLLQIADRLIEQGGIQGLILGGTELPLLLREQRYRDIPLFDTTKIHVEQAVAQMLS